MANPKTEARSLKLGRTPRGARVWLEGQYLSRAGFAPGSKILAAFAPGKLTITLDAAGDRTVSGKRGTIPVIDIIGAAVTEAFGPSCERLAVRLAPGKITVTEEV